MLTPVSMLMSNFPAKASFIPLSLKIGYAPCGLQLFFFLRGGGEVLIGQYACVVVTHAYQSKTTSDSCTAQTLSLTMTSMAFP